MRRGAYIAVMIIGSILSWNLLFSELALWMKMLWVEIMIAIGLIPILETRWPKGAKIFFCVAAMFVLLTLVLFTSNRMQFLL